MAPNSMTKRSRSRYPAAASYLLASVLVILGSSLQIQGNPLVYPNRFSFQKTSTTSTTPVPLTHDGRFNNSISSADYNKSDSGQSLKLSGGFRYDIAAWMIGALFVAGLLIIALYPRKRRRNHLSESTSACYVFPSNQNLKVIVDPACLPSSSSSEPVTY